MCIAKASKPNPGKKIVRIAKNRFTVLPSKNGDVLVSTGVVRLDKRAVAPNHDKMGNFLNLTDNNTVALAA